MIISTNPQGSAEWLEERKGLPTASEFDKIIMPAKGSLSASRKKYAHKLAAEMAGAIEEPFKSKWMVRGNDLEPQARASYALATGHEVQEVGFCLADDRSYGVSPDGLIDSTNKYGNGAVEIKCYSLPVFLEVIDKGEMPTKHIPQIQGIMMLAELDWLDFTAFFPGLDPFIVRVFADKEYQSKLLAGIRLVCSIRDKFFVEKLGGKAPIQAQEINIEF